MPGPSRCSSRRRMWPGGRIALELAEMAGEGDLLFVGDVLLAEDENGVLVHAGLDRGDLLGAERLAAVDPGDLSGEHRMQRADRNGHGGSFRAIGSCHRTMCATSHLDRWPIRLADKIPKKILSV